ncbi:hypothetical protein Hanom_Chr07g00676291 [Helianthus anomalus]
MVPETNHHSSASGRMMSSQLTTINTSSKYNAKYDFLNLHPYFLSLQILILTPEGGRRLALPSLRRA